MRRLLIASGNPGKVKEYSALLGGRGIALEIHDPQVDETGESYAANAQLKAQAAAKTGTPALGDDSGLEVEALGGWPGLRSARIAPTQPERLHLLLERLAGLSRPWRARFVCVLALAVPGQPTRLFTGERWGEITEPRSAGEGFGYDPVFLVPDAGKTFAELAPADKHRWSHRGEAVRALLASGALGRIDDP